MLFDFIIFGEKGSLFWVLHGWLFLSSSPHIVGASGLTGLGVDMGTGFTAAAHPRGTGANTLTSSKWVH